MLRSLPLLALALSPLAFPVLREEEQDPREREREKVERLIELMNTRELTERTTERLTKTFVKMGLPEEFGERFVERFDVDHVIGFSVDAYVERLDEETIDAMIEFYGSEQGRKLAAALPDLTIEVMEKGEAYGEEIGREIAGGR